MPLKCNMRHDKQSKKRGICIAQSYACWTRAKQWIKLLKYATFFYETLGMNQRGSSTYFSNFTWREGIGCKQQNIFHFSYTKACL